MTIKKLLAGLVAALIASSAFAQNVTLKVSHFFPPNSMGQKDVLEPWCKRLGEESGGRIKCQFYQAMQLGGTPPQLVDQAKDGVADVIWTAPSYSAGRFPTIGVLELPFMMPSGGLAGSRAMWEFYQKYAVNDFNAYRVLAVHSGSGQLLNTRTKPLLTLASMIGAKLRAPSRVVSDLVAALGATPVAMPVGQTTEAIAKGVVDGAMGPWDMLLAVKLDEVTRFHVEPPPGAPALSAVAMTVLMNKRKYEGLTPDLKAVIDRNSGTALVEAFGTEFDRSSESARKHAASLGNKILQIAPADYAAMRKAAAGVETQWIKETKSRLPNAESLVSAARAMGEKYLAK